MSRGMSRCRFRLGLKVTAETTLPAAYIIPAQWVKVIDVLAAHQVVMVSACAGCGVRREEFTPGRSSPLARRISTSTGNAACGAD